MVRRRSAKPLYGGSNPPAASTDPGNMTTCNVRVVFAFRVFFVRCGIFLCAFTKNAVLQVIGARALTPTHRVHLHLNDSNRSKPGLRWYREFAPDLLRHHSVMIHEWDRSRNTGSHLQWATGRTYSFGAGSAPQPESRDTSWGKDRQDSPMG